MSFQAVTWAIGQKAGSPSAKAALWSIANYANEQWCAWPSQATIAEESEQSADTVQRRLIELAEVGLIRRVPLRFAGRRTVDFIVLKPSPYFSAPLAAIEALLPRGCVVDSRYANEHGTEAQDAAAACGSDENATPTLPQTLPQSAADAAALVRQQEPVMEPRNQDERDARAREGKKRADGLAAFETRWPTAAVDDRVKTALAWNELTGDEQDAALAGVAPFLHGLKRAKRSTVPAAWKYLAQKSWTLLEAESAKVPDGIVDADSDQGRALMLLAEIAGCTLFSAGGMVVLTRPLSVQAMGVLQAPENRTAWEFIPASCGNAVKAWDELLADALRGKARPMLVGNVPLKGRGFVAPWRFPPRVDGTLSPQSTGPPASPLETQDDIAFQQEQFDKAG